MVISLGTSMLNIYTILWRKSNRVFFEIQNNTKIIFKILYKHFSKKEIELMEFCVNIKDHELFENNLGLLNYPSFDYIKLSTL